MRPHAGIADCVFVRGGEEENTFPLELFTNTSFVGCAFKQTQTVRYMYLPQNSNTLLALENCTFQLDGLQPGVQAVVLRNDRSGVESTKGVEDRVFSDAPIEVGIQDITDGYEDTYYELDAIEKLTVVVGPNLEKAPDDAFLSGDDEALVPYKEQLVGYCTSGATFCHGPSQLCFVLYASAQDRRDHAPYACTSSVVLQRPTTVLQLGTFKVVQVCPVHFGKASPCIDTL
jgi:hypothetical protein